MKNNLTIVLLLILFFQPVFGENLNIESSSVSFDKKSKLTIFKDKVIATDQENNKFKSEYAEYDKNLKLLRSKGKTIIITSEGYLLSGENIIFDNENNLIKSNYPSVIEDLEKNNIYLEKFEYSTKNKFFTSTGNIKILDSRNNSYNFTQIYIDEIKREILGTDIKAFLNQENFKINKKNKPRVFANTVSIKNQKSKFNKSIFTLCDYRENDKCPPWSLQASEMSHDKIKKTIYYDNAVIKFYDLPIFYLPRLSHPDPSVDRRSGFLPPSFMDTRNLGASFSIPYFFDINKDKDLTLSARLFESEHPLFLGEYRQAFQDSNLVADFGYTQGYKNTDETKLSGDKSHFFSKFVKNFKGKNNSENSFQLSLQDISNDKYLKLYKINTSLVDYETDNLVNSLDFTHENENLFLGFKASSYETLKDSYNDKYEYILPDVVLNKNLFSNNKYGSLDFQSNLKVHNYDTNKFTKFFINDFDWKFKNINFASGLKGRFLAKLKNVNYEAKNTSELYKDDTTSEFFGAVGYLSEIDLYKKTDKGSDQLLTPKLLLKYAPGHMRKEKNGARLNQLNVFNLDRLNSYNNFENGLNATIGFDYEIKNLDKKLNFSLAQIVNEKENKNMPSTTSLDEKLSDLVGQTTIKLNDKVNLNYNFALDQNYRDLNYNELGGNLDLNPIKFNFSYLQEKEHIGNQEYLKSNIELAKGTNGIFSFETKRNLITNSSEYYNLSYEYLNDCLRAGLVYRREFYNDSELESENSLMFKITLIPFGNINSPSFNK